MREEGKREEVINEVISDVLCCRAGFGLDDMRRVLHTTGIQNFSAH